MSIESSAPKLPCFVITPIGIDGSETRIRTDIIFDNIIAPVAEQLGYEANPAHRIKNAGLIDQLIIGQIRGAALLIADLSEGNPNVFYELALGHALKKPTVCLIRERDSIPFDINHFPVIKYEHPLCAAGQARTNLQNQLRDAIESIKTNPTTLENPISQILGKLVPESAESLKLESWDDLFPKLAKRLESFAGTIHIFNAELNTLVADAGKKFFNHMIENPNIERVRVTLPAHIYKRLEYLVSKDKSLYEILKNKIDIYPAKIPSESCHLALVYYEAHGDSRASDFCLILPKVEPFSSINTQMGQPSPWYKYNHYLVSSDREFNSKLRGIIKQVEGQYHAFTVDDVSEFVSKTPVALKDVLTKHNCLEYEQEMVVDGFENNTPPPTISHERRAWSVLRYSPPGRETFEVRIRKSVKDAVKPALLWLPPWGVQIWPKVMKELDNHLSRWFNVFHLQYSGKYRAQTFTRAYSEIRDAIRGIAATSDQLQITPNKIVLVAVSLSAFVAAEAAAAENGSIAGLCLLSPAIDLFDALDASRSELNQIELFTRRVYLGKSDFLAFDFPVDLDYFGLKAGPQHLLDLRIRGSHCCNKEFLAENVRDLNERKCPVFFGLSRSDEMTSFEEANDLVERIASPYTTLGEISWTHNIKEKSVIFDASWDKREELGIGPAIRFLKSLANDMLSE